MGGAEYQTGLLAEELAARSGVELTYLARHVPPDAAAQALTYPIIRIGTDAGIRRRAVLFDSPTLWRTLKVLRPQVIYQQAKQSYTAVCAHFARRHAIPFFHHVASDADLDNRWISLRLSVNTPFDITESLTGDWGIRHASHVIVQTAHQGETLVERFGVEAADIVRNFQPIPSALPTKPQGPLQVLWVANFKDVKRPELFVELAAAFASRADLRFVMVGRGAGLLRFEPLMARIQGMSNLSYLGEQPVERVYELMSAAAMHVNTSSFEGFPNTFIQAWARGAVVASIAIDPDGCMETQRIGYRAGSPEGLHRVIDQLSRSPHERQAVGERAFAYAQRHHSLAERSRFADLILAAARSVNP
jgi:glycosyltransferase involved in cell wall biosynthesis